MGGVEELLFTLGETKSWSYKASDDLSDSSDEDKEQKHATPSKQTAVRNPENPEFQICAPHQEKGKKVNHPCSSLSDNTLSLIFKRGWNLTVNIHSVKFRLGFILTFSGNLEEGIIPSSVAW